ncbi:hypothetical protein F7C95_04090 [Opitutia bacterium ISCC 51]|nr:hypothetical protein F7C95_04090 [Opitutae bacterium ISCC 51]QXD29161.1 hypothetical protein GA003_04070 [Opitutae bacterium ISCC 52]
MNPKSIFLIPFLLFFLTASVCGNQLPELDRCGGFKDIQLKATGFFRVDKVKGRHCFVTPDGHPYIALGANHIGKFLQDDSQNSELLARFKGDEEKAAEFLFQAVRDLALNAGEAYAPIDPRLAKRMPYVLNVTFPAKGKVQFDIFDPKVKRAFWDSVVEQVRPVKDDPFLLGIACPDLPLWDAKRADYYENLPEGSPGRLIFDRYFPNRQKELAKNRPKSRNQKTEEQFLGLVADTLYRIVSGAVDHAAPNHLFFGERFQLRSNLSDPVVAAVGKYVDVFCTQALIRSPQRPPEWQLFQADAWKHEYKVTGRPIMIIDWAAPFSLDHPYEVDIAMIKSEAEATEETNQFLIDSFDQPYIIGNFKCQLIGSHGNDSKFPEGRMKRTYLKDDGSPWPVRTEETRKTHIKVLNTVLKQLQGDS